MFLAATFVGCIEKKGRVFTERWQPRTYSLIIIVFYLMLLHAMVLCPAYTGLYFARKVTVGGLMDLTPINCEQY